MNKQERRDNLKCELFCFIEDEILFSDRWHGLSFEDMFSEMARAIFDTGFSAATMEMQEKKNKPKTRRKLKKLPS